MDPPLAALYARVKDRVSERDFLERVERARGEFDGLLDDEALGLLVLDELGLNEGAYVTLADLKGRAEATVRVTIERVEPPRTFERPGRDPGRVANIVVQDATGEARLVLWDKDVDRLDDGLLKAGARVTVVNARVKDGRFGAELHVGPWSVLEVEGALDPAKAKLLADVADTAAGAPASAAAAAPPAAPLPTALEGRVAWLSPTRPYRRPDGMTGFAADLDVETPEGPRRVVLWDEWVKRGRALAVGAPVRFEALAPKPRGATTEWHTTPTTRLDAA